MRIAEYYPWVYLTSGLERTILEICRRSRHQHTVFTNHYEPNNTYPEFRDLEVIKLRKVSVNRGLAPVLQAASVIALQKMDLSSYDLLVVHCEGLGDLALFRSLPVPVVCFCHTPLRPVFDLEYRQRVIERFNGIRRVMFNAFAAGFQYIDRKLWSHYSYVLFNSNETLGRAVHGGLLKGLEGRYEVLHPGIDGSTTIPTWRYDKYFLIPGRIMWTKNVELGLHAFVRFKKMHNTSDFRLVVAGRVDEKSQPYFAQLKAISAGRRDIEFVVTPSDDTLRELYANCSAVLFPSFNEDWGIVPLEANAYGKPVIACNRGGPKESQIDGYTGFLVPPDPNAFADAMVRIASEPYLLREMGRYAHQHAKKYDWCHFVARADNVMEELVRGSVPSPECRLARMLPAERGLQHWPALLAPITAGANVYKPRSQEVRPT